jgi:hypothetical protein
MGSNDFWFYFKLTLKSMAGMFIKSKMQKMRKILMFVFLTAGRPFQAN